VTVIGNKSVGRVASGEAGEPVAWLYEWTDEPALNRWWPAVGPKEPTPYGPFVYRNVRPLYRSPSAAAAPAGWRPTVDELAQAIRIIDGENSLGAGALAEQLHAWLYFTPSPAQAAGEK